MVIFCEGKVLQLLSHASHLLNDIVTINGETVRAITADGRPSRYMSWRKRFVTKIDVPKTHVPGNTAASTGWLFRKAEGLSSSPA